MKKRTRFGILGLTLALSGGVAGVSGTAYGHGGSDSATHYHELDSLGCGPIWVTVHWIKSGQAGTWVSCAAKKLGSGALEFAKGIVTKHEPFKTLAEIVGSLWDMVKEIKEACSPMSKLPMCALEVVAKKIPGDLGKFLQFLVGPGKWGDKFEKIGDTLAKFFGGWVDDVKSWIEKKANEGLDLAVSKVKKFVTEKVIDPVLEWVTNEITTKIEDAVQPIVARFLGTADKIEEQTTKIAAMIDESITSFGAKVDTAKAKLEEYEKTVDQFVNNAPNLVKKFAVDWLAEKAVPLVWEFVRGKLSTVWDWANDLYKPIRSAVVVSVGTVPFAGGVLAEAAGLGLDKGYSYLKKEVEEFIKTQINGITDLLKKKASELLEGASQTAGDLLKSVWNAIKGPLDKIKDKVIPFVDKALGKYKEISNKVRGMRNKVKEEFAKLQAAADGWKAQYDAAKEQLKNAGQKVVELPKYILGPPKEGYPPQNEEPVERSLAALAKEGPVPVKGAAAEPPPPSKPIYIIPPLAKPVYVPLTLPPGVGVPSGPAPSNATLVYWINAKKELMWNAHLGTGDGASKWSVVGGKAVGSGWAFNKVVVGAGGEIHSVNAQGQLLWFFHAGRMAGAFDWGSGTGKVVNGGWGMHRIVFAGAPGVVYGVTHGGVLHWYRHASGAGGTTDWKTAKSANVGSGWGIYKDVVGAPNGVIYGVKNDGTLVWYRHNGFVNGTVDWVPGKTVGSGWQGFRQIAAGANGVLYALENNGTLKWYRHVGHADGSEKWEGPKVIGTIDGGWFGVTGVQQDNAQPAASPAAPGVKTDASYRGTVSKTENGRTCQKWTVNTPHKSNYTPASHGKDGIGDHNYCRNPGNEEPRIWCYTTDPNPKYRWGYCNP